MRIFLLAFFLLPMVSFAQNFNESAISQAVLEKIAAEPDAYHPIIIMLENRVNLQQLVNHFDENRISTNERPKIVMEALKNKAATTQGNLLNYLVNEPNVLSETIHSFWVSNLIYVKAKSEIIAELSRREDVEWIAFNSPLKIESAKVSTAPPVEPNGIEPGLEVVGAPFMWSLGYTGYGQVAFCHDTGVDPNHPSFESNYRGLFVGDEAAWFEFDTTTMAAIPNGKPYDTNGHGTHVNGTMLGLDRLENDTVGVAFNAQWIAAATISNGIGTIDQVAAFQWSLDPDNNPDTVDDIPDVINNSWYDPSIEGEDCMSVYVPLLEAMEAVGMAVVFSAGNAGPGPMTITAPHNVNLNLVNSFTVAAINGNLSSLPVANFSSHGPSICGGEGSLLIKPEVSAPGVDVRSARPNGTYDFLSGTSMASPHVSGCILLLKEAFPELTGKELKEAIYFSCIDLGETGEDNIFGMGVVNVENAYNYLLDLGHTAVSPYRNTDALLIDFKAKNVFCENMVSIEDIVVENAGTDTLFSFNVNYSVGAFSEVFIWEGVLPPLARTSINLPTFSIPTGEQMLTISIAEPNNIPDERPFNNKLVRSIKVTDRSNIEAHVLQNDTICEGSNALLQANYSGNIPTEFQWYDALFDGNLLGTGDFYVTEELTEPTTVYASAIFKEKLGETEIDLNNSIEIDTINSGLRFDAFSDFTLKSILVYAPEKGVRQILLRDENDTGLGTKTIIVDSGFVRIDLDFDVPAGKNYRLIKTIGKAFLTNTETANFPYEINAVCSIKESTGPISDELFPHFYDWEIEYENPCLRTPVSVEISLANDLPEADFFVSQDTINLFYDETGEFSLTDNSIGAVNWLWHFSDGTTSTEQNPIHGFTNPGEYQITLTVTDEEGCSHSSLQTVTVIFDNPTAVRPSPINDSDVLIYPNPTTNDLQIAFYLSSRQTVNLTLVDAMGKEIKNIQNQTFHEENINWEMTNLVAGVYYLIFEIEGEVLVKKVVKL